IVLRALAASVVKRLSLLLFFEEPGFEEGPGHSEMRSVVFRAGQLPVAVERVVKCREVPKHPDLVLVGSRDMCIVVVRRRYLLPEPAPERGRDVLLLIDGVVIEPK